MQTFTKKMMAGLLAVAVLFGALAAACGGEEQQAAPAAPAMTVQQDQAEPQQEEEVGISVGEAVALVGQVERHADDAVSVADRVNGCTADDEQLTESVKAARLNAQETRDRLAIGLMVYLEDAEFSELDEVNELLRSANDAVERAERVEADLGVCGPLTDAEIEDLAGEMRTAYEEFWSQFGRLSQMTRDEQCNHPDLFTVTKGSADRVRSFTDTLANGVGTREREWIQNVFYRIDQTERDFANKWAAFDEMAKRVEEDCPLPSSPR